MKCNWANYITYEIAFKEEKDAYIFVKNTL